MDQINKKTGLFFGSFNPIHIGHLIVASQMVENSDLDQIWFVVTPQNPLKKKKTLLKNHHRLNLVKEAIDDDERFRATDVEFHLPQPNYTIHTLTVLTEKYPEREFALIMGTDNLATLHKWKNYQELLDQYKLYVYPRPGFQPGEFASHTNVHLVEAPQIEISASMIRDAIHQKKDLRYLLPVKVLRYIEDMMFYQ
ncbi:MAG: nicotinate-nucleotide adenylyltransferase [Bacteroidales bacterium]|nr:nicotinate-nucleotide adenylyltransferase [Bacteroidales bacterium]MCF8327127.1 nicotinate-nucleotide adenylyltransferase [Bacteroidales bacterium]